MGLKSALGAPSFVVSGWVVVGVPFLMGSALTLGDLNRQWQLCTCVGSDAEVGRIWI